jgi:hypothetical protein
MKFTVDVKEVWVRPVEVEMDSIATKEEILSKAKEKLDSGECGEAEPDYILDPESWTTSHSCLPPRGNRRGTADSRFRRCTRWHEGQ